MSFSRDRIFSIYSQKWVKFGNRKCESLSRLKCPAGYHQSNHAWKKLCDWLVVCQCERSCVTGWLCASVWKKPCDWLVVYQCVKEAVWLVGCVPVCERSRVTGWLCTSVWKKLCDWLVVCQCERSCVTGWLCASVKEAVWLVGCVPAWKKLCDWLVMCQCERSRVTGWLCASVKEAVWLVDCVPVWKKLCDWLVMCQCERSCVTGWLCASVKEAVWLVGCVPAVCTLTISFYADLPPLIAKQICDAVIQISYQLSSRDKTRTVCLKITNSSFLLSYWLSNS